MIDPAARTVLEAMRAEARPMPADQSAWLRGYRAQLAALTRWQGPMPAIAEDRQTVPGGPAIRVWSPPGWNNTVLFVHGGGFVAGSLDAYAIPLAHVALRSGWRMAAVDYRLAPEHPFPAAPDDAFAALRFLSAQGGKVALMGDSAGGLLACGTATRARDAGIPVASQILLYPNTDLRADAPYGSRQDFDGTVIRLAELYRSLDLYAGVTARDDPRLSPLFANVAGTAPAFVITNACDPLRDEADALADRLAAAAVPVRRLSLPGMIHGAMQYAAAVPAGDALLTSVAAFLRG